ncbi:hypothetical protein ACVWYH_002451 [Bradyrhizobium sp. GM24.11]
MLAGEEARQLLHLLLDRARGRQRIAGRRHQHGETGSRLAVQACVELVAETADLDPRDVAQPHGRTVGIGAQDDGAEFVRRGQLALDQHQRGGALARGRRLGADAARGHLRVLRGNRLVDVIGRQPIADELCRIDPHAKTALGRIERGATDARNAADLAEHVADHEVAQPDPRRGCRRSSSA